MYCRCNKVSIIRIMLLELPDELISRICELGSVERWSCLMLTCRKLRRIVQRLALRHYPPRMVDALHYALYGPLHFSIPTFTRFANSTVGCRAIFECTKLRSVQGTTEKRHNNDGSPTIICQFAVVRNSEGVKMHTTICRHWTSGVFDSITKTVSSNVTDTADLRDAIRIFGRCRMQDLMVHVLSPGSSLILHPRIDRALGMMDISLRDLVSVLQQSSLFVGSKYLRFDRSMVERVRSLLPNEAAESRGSGAVVSDVACALHFCGIMLLPIKVLQHHALTLFVKDAQRRTRCIRAFKVTLLDGHRSTKLFVWSLPEENRSPTQFEIVNKVTDAVRAPVADAMFSSILGIITIAAVEHTVETLYRNTQWSYVRTPPGVPA